MTTQTKLNVSSITTSTMMFLNVFSKPLHIPQAFHLILIFGVFIPLWFVFRYLKQFKTEKELATTTPPINSVEIEKRAAKKRLILVMVIGVVAALASPLILPFTGTTLGTVGDSVVGSITAGIVIVIVGMKLRKLS